MSVSNSGTIHKMECLDPWFTLIREGKKPVEGRKGKEKYRRIKPDDYIHFHLGDQNFYALVRKVDSFASIED